MTLTKSRWADVPGAMLELTRSGRITDVNASLLELLGQRRGAVVGTPLQRWVAGSPPKLEPCARPIMVTFQGRDDLAVHTSWTIRRSAVRGRLACAVRAREACPAGDVEAHLRQAQQVGRIGSWDLDLGSGRLWWSEEIFRIFEIDPRQFNASYDAFLALVHPEDRALVSEAYERSVEERGQYDVLHRLLLPGGRLKWVHERCETFYGEGGRPYRSLGTVQDVTERLQVQHQLDDRERRLAAIFNATREAMILFSVEPGGGLRVSDVNSLVHAQARRFLPDYQEQDFIGLPLEELCARVPEGMAVVLQHMTQRRWPAKLETVEVFEVAVPLPGVTAHAEVALSTVALEHGRPSLVLLVSRDITAHKHAEESLRAALSEKETLLREVHHRVKNNLQVISSLLSLQAGQVSSPTVVAALEESRARVQTMALIHERLYRSSRFGSIELAPHVRELLAMLAQTAEARRYVTLDCDVDDVELDLDTAIPLGLVLTELVSNAYKHAFPDGRPGHLVVRARALPEGLEVTVADDGVGLPPEFSTETSGSLGLRIVRTLVRQVRGEVEFRSGPGTAVHLRLPRPLA